MAKEIERKFLVKNEDFKSLAKPVYFHQGYLSTDIDRVVRVRIEENIAKITIKGKNKGFTRDEFEYIIPVSDAEYMLEHLCIKPTISKYRYKIPYKGHFWEVDQFQKENEGLIMAEVEIENEDENLILPEWIGKEVSGDSRYYNSALIDNPYCNWKKDI